MTSVEVRIGKDFATRILLRPGSTPTLAALMSSLPFDSTAHRWGDEIYFQTPFHSDLEPEARAEMSVGEVAYWPDGDALAIFFGPTPVSRDSKPRAYSPCNIVGRIDAGPAELRSVTEGARVKLRRTD